MRGIFDLRLLQSVFAAIMLIVLAGTVGAALTLQYGWGFLPCELCLMERVPYYAGALIMAAAFAAAMLNCPPKWIGAAFIIVALLMLYNVGLSVYHVGVELKYWPGPDACSSALGALPGQAGALLDNLNTSPVIPCSLPAGYIFGISFAGWNGICAFFYMLAALAAAYLPFRICRKKTA